ncbi:MAG: tRNA lysidine(34) synthetase TilS [Desulfobacteraceae bacterium]|nr:tRNA lysidine(34) synthetase TilS [Desulfobacteraceae bacterium]
MHPLVNKTGKLIRGQGLIAPGEMVVVGVSAGPDSMALLQVLAALRAELSCSLVAAYLDHGLRPGETEREGRLVAAAAENLSIPCRLAGADVQGAARREKVSVEHAGRLVRYHFFERVAVETGAAKIAVAHTADDQAEEVLLRLIRGTGRAGLAGMKALREGRIIRPFLPVAKAELLAFLDDLGLSWCEDSSNRDRRYLRNRVRLDLLPELARRFNPSIGRTLRQTAAILGDEEELLADLARQACGHAVSRTEAGGLPAAALDLAAFAREPKALHRRMAEAAFLAVDHPPAFREIEQVLRLADGRGGGRLHLAAGLRVARQGGRLLFAYPGGRRPRRGDVDSAERNWFLEIAGPGVHPLPDLGKEVVVELAGVPSAAELRKGGADYLDAAAAPFPLSLRSPRPGDRFRPLGAPGSRKVGDFLTDRKLAPEKRWQVPVLVFHNEIVALLGLRISHEARVTAATRSVLRIYLH